MSRNHSLFAALAACSMLPALAVPAIPEAFSDDARARLTDMIEVEPTEHTLNVVYFIGSDREPVADYERRISELLIYLQQYYAKEMDRNGFGKRAFGLVRRPDGMVDIQLVRGKEPGSSYDYSTGGANRCIREIDEYFAAHPDKKNSVHTFVIMPTWYDEKYSDMSPGGVPFFGYGKWCFALDYAHFDIKHLGAKSRRGHLLTKWYGGFAHELGHGLNLPHNNGTPRQNARLGTALMGSGNYTFGLRPTYLTKATCAILDRSETFARKGDKTKFYGPAKDAPRVDKAKLRLHDGKLSLRFRMKGSCAHVNAYVQDPPCAVNQDYEAVAFTAKMGKPAKDGSRLVTLTIPVDSLSDLKTDDKQLSVYFLQPDGNRFRWNTTFHWSKIPDSGEIPLNPEQPAPAGY